MRFLIGFILCQVIMLLVSGALANVIVRPMLEPDFGPGLRVANDTAGAPHLMIGFTILAMAMTVLYPRLDHRDGWVREGLWFGLAMGALELGHYFIVVGWSTLNPAATILAGLVGAAGPVAGGVALSAYFRSEV